MRIFALAKLAKFRQNEISFDSMKISERFDEFSREQRTKNTEFRLHLFCTVLYIHDRMTTAIAFSRQKDACLRMCLT